MRATTSAPPVLDPAWSEVVDVVVPELAGLVVELAARGVPAGVPGHEEAGLPVELDLAWPGRRIAVVVSDDPERNAWLDAHGWTRVPAQAEAVIIALSPGGSP